MTSKLSWIQYFIEVAKLIAKKSSCSRRQIGAVIVKDNMIVSTGYNGTPRGIRNCNDGGCERCSNPETVSGSNLHECICVHAEENAIVQAAYQGISTKGASLFTSFCPCLYCAKSIVNAGIIRVFYNQAYAMDEATIRLFNDAGVEIERYG
ncbi:dCMP deaminase family protein [Candidatus Woesearchaeota archaeon]|nr:dCMP deaminase family protein [Candidatus Woesearchaeota archaeon]